MPVYPGAYPDYRSIYRQLTLGFRLRLPGK
jgi:hypothetical protein